MDGPAPRIRRVGRSGVAAAALVAAAAACGGAGDRAQRLDVPSLATAQALSAGDPAACGASARASLDALAQRYAGAPEVNAAQRAYYATCGEWQALADLLDAIPAALRSEADTVALARIQIRYLQQFAAGEALIRPLVDAQPDNLDYASLLAASLYYQQRFGEAVAMVDRLWQPLSAARNADIMTMRAEAFMEEGKVDRAIRVLEDVLAFSPDHEFARTVLGRALAIGGDAEGSTAVQATAAALRATREADLANSTWVNDRLTELRAAFDARRYDESERLARAILPRLPENRKHEMYGTLADILVAMGRFDGAAKAQAVAAALAAGTPEAAIPAADRP